LENYRPQATDSFRQPLVRPLIENAGVYSVVHKFVVAHFITIAFVYWLIFM